MLLTMQRYLALKRLTDLVLDPPNRYVDFRRQNLKSLNHSITHFSLVYTWIGEQMSKKKPTTKAKFVWNGYVNIPIPSSEAGKCELTIKDNASVMEAFNRMIWNGYTFKFYADEKSESVKLVCTCHEVADENFGFAISSYAGDWYTALAVLVFKHFDIANENWNSFTTDAKSVYG